MQDPTEFRKRFLLYKEGKMPYENGLPKYKNGTGGDVPAYQRFVEEMGPVLFGQIVAQGVKNPEKAYRNMITQLAYESNYGTSSVARNLNNYGGVGWNGKTYTTYKDKADFAKNYVRLMNSRYKNVITADTLLDYAKGLKGLGYYEDSLENYARNLTGMKSFAKALDSHIANNPDLYTVVSGKPMSQTTAAELHAASLFEPAPVVIHSDYPINNPSPSSISSWNNPTSPAFNTSELYTRRATNNINNVVQDILFNDKDVLDALMDNLSNNVFGGKRLGFKNGKLPKYGDGTVGTALLKGGASLIPGVGTAIDAYDLYKEPSLDNLGYLILSGIGDAAMFTGFGGAFGLTLKNIRNAAKLNKARKTVKALSETRKANDAIQLYEAKKAYNLSKAAATALAAETGNIMDTANEVLQGFKNGKSPIHINPANRGKFNATKKRTGKTTEQLAHSSNPLTRKRAIFALNARKWHH